MNDIKLCSGIPVFDFGTTADDSKIRRYFGGLKLEADSIELVGQIVDDIQLVGGILKVVIKKRENLSGA